MTDRGLLDFIISRLKDITYREKILLCESFSQEKELLKKSKNKIESILGRRLENNLDLDIIRKQAESDAKMAGFRGIKWVSWLDSIYPPMLREIYDPPVMLFYRGRLPETDKPLVAIVGTRKPSPQASAQAYDIAKGLGSRGISVVSGLALGIDSMAHRGNIDGGAATVAILGSGADEIYPSSNRNLARKILDTGGALLSEYPVGTGPRKWTFPARNRLISGVSRGVLIVEAPAKSGALITAGFALEQNRELWVSSVGIKEIKAGIFDRNGTIKLAQDGARVIDNASDILYEE